MSTVNERFQELIEALKMNPNSFAAELNMRSTAIYNIINGKNKPSYDLMKIIIDKFGISPNWLISGYGNMFWKDEEDKECINPKLTIDLLSIHRGGVIPSTLNLKMQEGLSSRDFKHLIVNCFGLIINLCNNYNMLVDLIQYLKMPESFISRFPQMDPYLILQEVKDEYSINLLEDDEKDMLARRYKNTQMRIREIEVKIDNLILSISLERDLINVG